MNPGKRLLLATALVPACAAIAGIDFDHYRPGSPDAALGGGGMPQDSAGHAGESGTVGVLGAGGQGGTAEAGDSRGQAAAGGTLDASLDGGAADGDSGGNAPPQAGDLEITVVEGTRNNLGALPGSDVDGDPLQYRIVTGARKGAVTIEDPAVGHFKYSSVLDLWGNDDFEYQVNDGRSDAPAPGRVRVLVLPMGPLLVRPDPPATDFILGPAVDIQGTTALIGSQQEPSHGGKAFVARRQGDGSWQIVQRLDAGDQDASVTRFGEYVALDGDWALITAWGDWNEETSLPGRVFFFKRGADGLYRRVEHFGATNPRSGDNFGSRLAISGEWAAIAVPSEGNRLLSGAVHLYRRTSEERWAFSQAIVSPASTVDDLFGFGVALEGNTLVIGAANDDEAGLQAGAAYAYRFDGTWQPLRKLMPREGGGLACEDVALSGDTVLCTARQAANSRGAAYAFSLSAPDQVVLTPLSQASPTFEFGWRVALDGDIAVIMHHGTEQLGTGYVYRRLNGVWAAYSKVTTGSGTLDLFQLGVAVSAGTVVATSALEASSAYFFHVAPPGIY